MPQAENSTPIECITFKMKKNHYLNKPKLQLTAVTD